MPRRDRRGHGGPPADPFGTNDPAWERYEGVSGLRRWKPSFNRTKDRRRGEFASFMLIEGLAVLGAAGAIALLFWLTSIL